MKKIQYVFAKTKFGKGKSKKNLEKCNRNYCKMSARRISHFYEPIGINQIHHVAKYLKQSINVWSKDQLIYSCGNYLNRPIINVAYIGSNVVGQVGHFILENRKVALTNEKVYPNNCFYDIVRMQTGVDANILRRSVIRRMQKTPRRKSLKKLFNTSDILGGASYVGKSAKTAQKILDSSQNGESHPDKQPGHPRGHASHPEATGSTDSVEKYSKTGRKTGFLSRADQDFVAHLALETDQAQDAMELMNLQGKDSFKEAVKILSTTLDVDPEKLPRVQEWRNGDKTGQSGRFNDVVLVMKHFYNKYNEDFANVFVLTFYPRL